MLKLWIVHRSPQQRASLARLGGLPHSEFAAGPPAGDDFDGAAAPAAVVMGLEGDFEHELDFAHRHRRQLAGSRWLLLCRSEDAEEAARLFATVEPEIAVTAPTARVLRALVSRAVAHRRAASLAERETRERLAERFSAWLGGVEVPGLLRALDPSLSRLPLLVRGRPGSGRSLLGHYLELHRGSDGEMLRLHGRDLRATSDIERRLAHAAGDRPFETVWIDDIDLLSPSAQDAFAEWIVHGSAIVDSRTSALRWIATAGPASLEDRLEPALEQAFAPLRLEVPALADHPETFAAFAEEVSRDWTRSVGGVPRRFSGDALESLAAHPWSGDRAEVEAVLRTTLAASSRETIDESDLRFPSDPDAGDSEAAPTGAARPIEAIRALMEEPEVEAREAPGDESARLPSAVFEDATNAPTSEPAEGGLLAEPTFAAGEADESMKLAEAAFGLTTPEPPETQTLPLESEEAAAESSTVSRSIEATEGWRRLARSLSHEIRNPLVSIRTFAELLPEHFEDETFRARFTELVGKDVAHISDVLARLSGIAERETIESEPVDVSAMIEALLEERRERITRGRLLVLRELERDAPLARADAKGLEIALAGLLDRALESLPERGDLFVATRRLERGSDGQPRLRILLRHHNPTRESAAEVPLGELEPTANLLEYVLAEAVVEGSGGSLTIDATDAGETLILVDLQTPG